MNVRRPPRRIAAALLVALLSLTAIGWSAWRLSAIDGIAETPVSIGRAPATAFTPIGAGPGAPTVIVAHGFSGSQQLMRPIALALAEAGFRAITLDFLGHGRHPDPLTGDIASEEGATVALTAQLAEAVAFARRSVGPDGPARVAFLGHSMAADIVVRAAQADPEIAAVVAVSIFSPAPTGETPRDLLIVTGAYEGALRREALRIVGLATRATAPEGAAERTTYDAGPAGRRRAAVAPGVEHIGVLYSAATMAEATAWLSAAFDVPPRVGPPEIARGYGAALLTLLAGVAALAWPLSKALPRLAPPDRRTEPPTGLRFAAAALLPAIVTPIALWILQIEFLPVLVADYLAQHFALYGALTFLMLRWARPPGETPQNATSTARIAPETRVGGWERFGGDPAPSATAWLGAAALGAVAVAAYGVIALGAPIEAFATSFTITPERSPLLIAMSVGALLYFVADEQLVRAPNRGLGARLLRYVVVKACFIASLAAAIALDLERLFFLIIITPVIVAAFVVFGLFGAWAYRRTGVAAVGGVGVAIACAWAIAATFPRVGL